MILIICSCQVHMQQILIAKHLHVNVHNLVNLGVNYHTPRGEGYDPCVPLDP